MHATTPHHATAPREHGFGMIEAIVAATIVLLIGAAISTTFISTVRTQNKSTKAERKLGAAEGLFERLKADSTWAGPAGAGCSTMPVGRVRTPCDANWMRDRYVNDAVLVQDTATQGVRYEAELDVFAIDDTLDGTGREDEDGQRPDYYEATVRVRRQGSTDQWSTLSGNIEPPGRVSAGAIAINICAVTRQWDERVPLASCEDRRPKEILLGYPAGSALAAHEGKLSDRHARYDWDAALDRAPLAAGTRGWSMVTYTVAPAANTTIQLSRTDGQSVRAPGFTAPEGCSSPSPSVVQCVTSPTRPIMRVTTLTPGRYTVRMTRYPDGYEPWPLHSIPSGDTAIVEAGRTSRVLQVIKPVNRSSYDVNLWNCDHTLRESFSGGPCVAGPRRGVAGWIAPAASARAEWSFNGTDPFSGGAASAGGTTPTIRFENFVPGLYSPRIVTPGQSSIRLRSGPGPLGAFNLKWLWMDPVRDGLGGDEPASGQTNYTYEWCNYDRRVAFLAGAPYYLGPDGGIYNHPHPIYRWVQQEDGTWDSVYVRTDIHQHHLYGADRCERASSGGPGAPPPGPGSGGA